MHGVGWAQALCRSESLPSRARLVGLALAVHCTKGDSPSCRASLRTLMRRTGLTRPTVVAALADLAAEGWIAPQLASRPSAKGGRSHGTTSYMLTAPTCGQVGDNSVDEAVDNLGTTPEVVKPVDQGGKAVLPPRGKAALPLESKRILKGGADSEPPQRTPDPDRRAAVLDLVSRIATNKRT